MNGMLPPSAHRVACSGPPPRRAGYTLLEVLIATLLTTVLMATLWGIFHVYLALFDKGERLVWETQFEQAVLRQLFFDLQGVGIPPAPPPDHAPAWTAAQRLTPSPNSTPDEQIASVLQPRPPDAAAPAAAPIPPSGANGIAVGPAADTRDRLAVLPQLGLEGGSDWLEISTLQHVPELMPATLPEARPNATTAAGPDLSGEATVVRAPMLRRIRYAWSYPEDAADETLSGFRSPAERDDFRAQPVADDEPLPAEVGLVRVEGSWEEPQRAAPWDPDAVMVPAGDATFPRDPQQEPALDAPPGRAESEQPGAVTTTRRDLYPALAGLFFRYFDGMDWHDRWSSRERGHLPVALEVYVLHRPRQAEQTARQPASAESDPPSEPTGIDAERPAAAGTQAAPVEPGDNLLADFDPSAAWEPELAATSEEPAAVHRLLITWSSDHCMSYRDGASGRAPGNTAADPIDARTSGATGW